MSTRCGDTSIVWRCWGKGHPLPLLHGASGSWTHWIRNVAPLSTQFHVIAPDMPGFGDSDTPPEPHTAEGIAEMLASTVYKVIPSSTEIHIAGFSFGGIIGGLIAARLGRAIKNLVLLGAGGLALPRVKIPPLHRIRADMSLDEIRAAHRRNLQTLMIANSENIDDLAVFAQIQNTCRAHFKTGNIPTSDVLLRALPAIQARVSGIWGSKDAFVGAHLHERKRVLASAHPDLDFRVVDGAGHWVIYETPDRVNTLLLEILRKN